MTFAPEFLLIAYVVCYVLGYVAHEVWTVLANRPQSKLPSQLGLVGIGTLVMSSSLGFSCSAGQGEDLEGPTTTQ